VNTPDDTNWRAIFSLLLEEQQPEVGGRECLPAELQSKLERLARGEADEAEIQNLCEQIVLSPDALTSLARLLRNSKGKALPEGET
jgi:hypothetical protein